MVGVEIPKLAVEQPHFVAVKRITVEVARHGVAVDASAHRLEGNEIHHAIVVGVDQPTKLIAIHAAIGGNRVEAGRHLAHAEFAGEDVVGVEPDAVGQIAVGEIGIGGIKNEISIGVNQDRTGRPGANLRP